jgi:hypothetical protein
MQFPDVGPNHKVVQGGPLKPRMVELWSEALVPGWADRFDRIPPAVKGSGRKVSLAAKKFPSGR